MSNQSSASSIPTWTLERFLRAKEKEKAGSGELTELIASISVAVKILANIVATAGFKGLHGYTETTNASGEITAALDREADEVFIQFLSASGHFGLIVSEEQDEPDTMPVVRNMLWRSIHLMGQVISVPTFRLAPFLVSGKNVIVTLRPTLAILCKPADTWLPLDIRYTDQRQLLFIPSETAYMISH